MAFEFDEPLITEAAGLLSMPGVQLCLCFFLVFCVYSFLFLHNYYLGPVKSNESKELAGAPSSLYVAVETYLQFAWNCFFKPQTHSGSRNQQDALEGFYKAQASIYDATRSRLLRGREDMLGLVAAQLKYKIERRTLPPRPTWVDLGGGTGYNIEAMGKYVDVPNFFGEVYLVDLSPSLCSVAEDRFTRLGWKNVKVVCQDVRHFRLEDYQNQQQNTQLQLSSEKTKHLSSDLITMSYSLSMIPEYYSVVDSLSSLLSANGVIGVTDFYVQSEVDYQARNYTGGELDRHCMWISRVFWRTWFEADRDYLEYRFGTVLSFNGRNHMFGLRIPFYVWVGCGKDEGNSQAKLAQMNAAVTESPFLGALELQNKALEEAQRQSAIEIRSKAYESAIVNLAASLPLPASWYQTHHWRIYYDESLPKHRQFKDEYIYAFTWEDAQVDTRLLKIKEDDVILAITSAGDNILEYALQKPKRIHAVDLNPAQNHILELKLAAYTTLDYNDFWALFGSGTHASFRDLLINKLSPHLSSSAFQFWLHTGPKAFSGSGFYFTGCSRHAIKLVSWLFRIFGLKGQISRICEAQTLNEQREIWNRSIRRVLLSQLLSWTIISNKAWLWRALGVPSNQREMIEEDYAKQVSPLVDPTATVNEPTPSNTGHARKDTASGAFTSGRAIWEYVVNTFDPMVRETLLSTSNHYYLLCMLGHYTSKCHPGYLTQAAHRRLSRPGAFDGVRIHTDELGEVVERMQPETLTIAVVMDSMDWFSPSDEADAPAGEGAAAVQVRKLKLALKIGGRVLLRSAGLRPWYIDVFEADGFRCKRVACRMPGTCTDRVNMYASTWICTKLDDDTLARIGEGTYTPSHSRSSSRASSPASSPRISVRSPPGSPRASDVSPRSPRAVMRHFRHRSRELMPLSIGEASITEEDEE